MPEKPLAVTQKFYPTDDTYTDSTEPNTTHGDRTYIFLDTLSPKPPEYPEGRYTHGYIKFDISTLKIPEGYSLRDAKLLISLAGRGGAPNVAVHHCLSDELSEDLATWNNWNPPYESIPDDVQNTVGMDFRDWMTLDVTKTLKAVVYAGKKFVSFILIGENFSSWASKEYPYASYLPTLVVTYEYTPGYVLSIDSSPVSGVPFTLDGLSFKTPFSSFMDEGTYIVTMPSTVTIGGVQYEFVNWVDGVTTPSRMINLIANMSLTANYRATVPTHTVTVRASPEVGVPATVDGRVIGNTPVSVEVIEGDHVFSVPNEVEV